MSYSLHGGCKIINIRYTSRKINSLYNQIIIFILEGFSSKSIIKSGSHLSRNLLSLIFVSRSLSSSSKGSISAGYTFQNSSDNLRFSTHFIFIYYIFIGIYQNLNCAFCVFERIEHLCVVQQTVYNSDEQSVEEKKPF